MLLTIAEIFCGFLLTLIGLLLIIMALMITVMQLQDAGEL